MLIITLIVVVSTVVRLPLALTNHFDDSCSVTCVLALLNNKYSSSALCSHQKELSGKKMTSLA